MRTGVLTSSQSPESSQPEHFCPAKVARAMCAYRINGKRAAEPVRKGLIWIRAEITYAKLKALIVQFRDNSIPRYVPRNYIPRATPPAEVSGCHFLLPPGARATPAGLELLRREWDWSVERERFFDSLKADERVMA